MRVKIYDALNEERLLGSIRRPTGTPMPCYRVQTCDPVRVVSSAEMQSIDTTFDIIELRFTYLRSKSGWNMRGIYTTYSKLKRLMRVRDFRLPGESDTAASYRWYSQ